MEKRVYGIDIGGTSIKIGRFDQSGTLKRKWSIQTDVSDKGKRILADIAHALRMDGMSKDNTLGVGFGVPGPVLDNVVNHAVNLGWNNLNLETEFKRLLPGDYNIKVANDANLAALGEQSFGAGSKHQNIVFFTLGTGVGGGIIESGKIIEGAHGAGGEIGHMKLADLGFRCNCGNYDCLETVASATGVKRLAKHHLETTTTASPLRNDSYISAKMVFSYAEAGDELSLRVVEAVSDYLAHACQVLSIVTNPEAFIFGGGLANAGEFLIGRIERKFKALAFPAVKETKFYQASLGNDAGIYGAFSGVMIDG